MNYYQTEGAGPGIVLLPGLGCDDRMWRSVGSHLKPRYTVIYADIRRAGTIEAAASRVGDAVAELGLDAVGVAGLSMGGYVAFECLRQWPQRIRAVSFLDTTAYPDTPERTAGRHQTLRLIQDGQFARVLDTFIASVLPPGSPDGAAARCLRTMAEDGGPETFAADMEAILRRGSFEDVLSLARIPVLFLAGELDSLTPVAVARQMTREVPGARVETVAGTGHMTALEAPEQVAGILDHFFADAMGTAPT